MFETIDEGFVTERRAGTPTAVAAGSRAVVADDGELVCTYMVQKALGLNDFTPMLSRSADLGTTWREQGAIWPALRESYAIFGSVSRSPEGNLYFYGERTPIDEPGESSWSDETQGLKQNELIWATSPDGGRTWTDPVPIPMPFPGSAEAPGVMCITRGGRWMCCYAPYNTFDPNVVVERNRVVLLLSDDRGETWHHTNMLSFEDADSGGAEAWVIELADGRLLGTSWHLNHRDGSDYPNAYALSLDGGLTWQPTRSTGIMGQSTALAPLPDGRALFIYNRRKHGEIGVWLALVRPTESDLGIEANEIIWRAQTPTQEGSSAAHAEWTGFSFGEPSVTLLPDNTLLATLWCIQPNARGIRYVKLRIAERTV